MGNPMIFHPRDYTSYEIKAIYFTTQYMFVLQSSFECPDYLKFIFICHCELESIDSNSIINHKTQDIMYHRLCGRRLFSPTMDLPTTHWGFPDPPDNSLASNEE